MHKAAADAAFDGGGKVKGRKERGDGAEPSLCTTGEDGKLFLDGRTWKVTGIMGSACWMALLRR